MKTIATLLLATLTPAALLAAEQAPAPPWVEQSRQLANQLGSQLKSELTAAIAAGGPVSAIDVCHARSPQIAARLSQESGAQVGRTALRVRNPANAPDGTEREVLEQFGGVQDHHAAPQVLAQEGVAMRIVDDRINELIERQGWNDATMLSMLEQFIMRSELLEELIRVGAAAKLSNDRVRVLARSYLPSFTDPAALEFMSVAFTDLASTLARNLEYQDRTKFFERRAWTPHGIPAQDLPAFANMVAEQGQAFLERLDD